MGVPEPKGYFKYVVIASGILAVLAVHTGWRMMQDRETLAKVRKSVREDLVERLRDFHFEFGRLPSDIEEFFSTDYLPPEKDIGALQELGYNDPENGRTIFDVSVGTKNKFYIEHSPGRLRELRQEILKEAKANGFDKGIDPNVEHAPAPTTLHDWIEYMRREYAKGGIEAFQKARILLKENRHTYAGQPDYDDMAMVFRLVSCQV